jgi:hypothetical protein
VGALEHRVDHDPLLLAGRTWVFAGFRLLHP